MKKFILGSFLCLLNCILIGFSSEAAGVILDKPQIASVLVDSNNVVKISIQNETVYSDWDYDDYFGSYDDSEDEDYDEEENYDVDPATYELYRSDTENGEYQLVNSGTLTADNNKTVCIDNTAQIGKVFYYKVRFASYSNGNVYGEFCNPLKVTVIPSPGKIKYVRATKAKTFTIKWNSASNIDGYDIYIKEFKNEYLSSLHTYSRYETDGIQLDSYEIPDKVQKINYKLVKSVSAKTTSYQYKKAKHGYGYLVAIRTYKLVDGVKMTSSTMYASHGVMDYYFCYNAENTKYNYKWPKKQRQAEKACTTIKVKMWDFQNHAKHSGAKKTRIQYITVNKKYAETIKQIYKEIYANKTKPPIYEAGSYRWRPDESAWSYHTVGTAIDMNCNENPMYSYSGNKKKIVVGSFYKPKSNPYSMPRNGVIEKTFAKYGFVRLNFDLMHYQASGVCYSSNYK